MNWGGNQQEEVEKAEERVHNRRWERLGVDSETTRMEGNPGDGRQNRMFGSWLAYNIREASCDIIIVIVAWRQRWQPKNQDSVHLNAGM